MINKNDLDFAINTMLLVVGIGFMVITIAARGFNIFADTVSVVCLMIYTYRMMPKK